MEAPGCNIVNFLKKFCATLLILCSIISCQPKYKHYNSALYDHVNRSIFMLKDAGHGGTGFIIKTATGHTYMVTNSHVCDIGKEAGYLWASNVNYPFPTPIKIIEQSHTTDLCILEPVPGAPALELGIKPNVFDNVTIVGYPWLSPLNESSGKLTGEMTVKVLDHEMDQDNPKDKCNEPKNKIITEQEILGTHKYCIDEVDAYTTSVQTYPGNSGSPVFNEYGQVVAVVFAGDREVFHGLFIPYQELTHFLLGK